MLLTHRSPEIYSVINKTSFVSVGLLTLLYGAVARKIFQSIKVNLSKNLKEPNSYNSQVLDITYRALQALVIAFKVQV